MPVNKIYDISFRCYFPDNGTCNHFQAMPLSDIPKWIECYCFTHPTCISISVKVWFAGNDV